MTPQTYIHDCLGPPEVPPLTNLKKLNKTFNTERFPWGIGPSHGMMIYGLKHTYMLGDIHTCLDTSDIHTIHTYVCLSMYVCMLTMYVCMLSMYVCMYVRASGSTPPTNLKKMNKTFNTEGFPWGIGPSLGMMIYGLKHTYACMYAKLVCMYVRASGSTPPHKSQKIELSFKYWTFFVRNRTHPIGR